MAAHARPRARAFRGEATAGARRSRGGRAAVRAVSGLAAGRAREREAVVARERPRLRTGNEGRRAAGTRAAGGGRWRFRARAVRRPAVASDGEVGR
ncbi:unnamed protein product [Boreogadus saida]